MTKNERTRLLRAIYRYTRAVIANEWKGTAVAASAYDPSADEHIEQVEHELKRSFQHLHKVLDDLEDNAHERAGQPPMKYMLFKVSVHDLRRNEWIRWIVTAYDQADAELKVRENCCKGVLKDFSITTPLFICGTDDEVFKEI